MTIRKQKVPRRPGRPRFTMVVPSKSEVLSQAVNKGTGRALTDWYVNWINCANHYKT